MAVPHTTREHRLPKSTQVLVKVQAVSLQYGDLTVAKGEFPFQQKENLVPGSDMAGEIIALGEDVTGWQLGERVCSNFATDDLFGDSVFRSTALTGYSTLIGTNSLKGGDTVLVQGTGGVSIFALQLTAASGASVTGILSSNQKLETKGRGVDHVIDVGRPQTLLKSDNCVRYGGTVQIIGFIAGQYSQEAKVDLSRLPLLILGKSVQLRSNLIGSRTNFIGMDRLITAANLRPVIDRVSAFEHLREAYEYQAQQQHVRKIVIKVSKA
ncbi:hypothetical protein C8T65DRAFT_710227 [Cerioporus squamosus]|nr:hypothetical protein C8T65DRAFT_710227 [Cerioporus squamosus]